MGRGGGVGPSLASISSSVNWVSLQIQDPSSSRFLFWCSNVETQGVWSLELGLLGLRACSEEVDAVYQLG